MCRKVTHYTTCLSGFAGHLSHDEMKNRQGSPMHPVQEKILASNQALLICVGGIKSLVHTVCACAENSRGLDGCDEIIIIDARRDERRGQAKNMAASS